MSHAVPVSDETYRAIEALAYEQGTSPETLVETLLKAHLHQRHSLLRQNAEWAAGLDEALARATRGENVQYDSTGAFFAALDDIPSEESDR